MPLHSWRRDIWREKDVIMVTGYVKATIMVTKYAKSGR